jgi:hypothetical protein
MKPYVEMFGFFMQYGEVWYVIRHNEFERIVVARTTSKESAKAVMRLYNEENTHE